MNVEVTITFRIKNLISKEDLNTFYDGNLFKCTKETIASEGLFGIVEDDFRIVNVERGGE